jgi:deoxyribose-phosphate aldolase
MRAHSPPEVEVKASGGIRTFDELLGMRPFVTRVGLSRTREILDECRSRLGLPAISSVETTADGY